MALVKMGQPGSSLSRSPSIKSGVDSLTCLSSLTITDDTRRERLNESRTMEIMPPRRNEISRYNQQRLFEIQLLLPPATLIIILIFWWYTKAHSNGQWNTASKTSLPSWIDFFAALLFFAALIQCVRLAFSHLTLRSQESALILLRASLSHNGGCLSIAWPKHISSILTDQSVTANKLTSPSVIWTIGSKSKCERSNLCGERVLRYANDDIYEGEIYEGSCSGSGVHYFCSSGKYEGDWVDGKYNGYGIETWAPGSRYKGQFQQGLRNGYGVYRFQTGDEYSGEWLHGQSHGYGVQTCNDGSRYIGEFKRGMKHGIGYYRFR
ncbi:hypothetical protein O6H91_17G036500 [Diphasiastrum complanatum]|nr:hypothetical protein O6H91_17G036500 [Diphasiastrum complanatum]